CSTSATSSRWLQPPRAAAPWRSWRPSAGSPSSAERRSPMLESKSACLLLALLSVAPACRPLPGSSSQRRLADLIVYGRVWTGDSARPWAQAVAVAGDTIAAVGDSAAVAKLAGGNTRVMNNGRALVAPGFMDGHLHFTDGGFQ